MCHNAPGRTLLQGDLLSEYLWGFSSWVRIWSLGGSCRSSPQSIKMQTLLLLHSTIQLRSDAKPDSYLLRFLLAGDDRGSQKILKICKNVHPVVPPRARVDFMCLLQGHLRALMCVKIWRSHHPHKGDIGGLNIFPTLPLKIPSSDFPKMFTC